MVNSCEHWYKGLRRDPCSCNASRDICAGLEAALKISHDNSARICYGRVDVITWVIDRTLDLVRRGIVVVDIPIPSGTGDIAHRYYTAVSSVLGRKHGR